MLFSFVVLQALRQMLDEVQKDSSLRGLVLDEHEALKYVRARKNDALRSVQLLRSHMVSYSEQ